MFNFSGILCRAVGGRTVTCVPSQVYIFCAAASNALVTRVAVLLSGWVDASPARQLCWMQGYT